MRERFVINKSEQSTAARAAFDEAANSLKGKIVLSWSQIEENIGKRLGDFLGIKDSELPLVYIVKPADGDVKKFRMEGEITTESILAYHAEYVAGNLKTKLKSDEVPETNDEPVKIAVGKSFNDIVMDETKDVFVEFYAPWCGHCKTLAPKYDELATKLKANPNIVIAKMDSTTNEVDGVSVSGFPTLKFFPSNRK
jgi:protein disulfide-isomerase A1